LKRLIQNKILTPVASMIISKGIMKGGVVAVGIKDNQFTFDVKKGKKGSILREEFIFNNIHPNTVHIPKNSDSTKIQTPYRSANAYINPDLEQIKKVAETIVNQTKSFRNRLKKINEYVISTLSYGGKYTGLYSVHDALEKPEVDCGGFDALFVSLCIAVGIPARIVSGFWLGYDKNEMHAWVEILSRNNSSNNPRDDEWIPADPSVEQLRRLARTRHLGKLGSIGSDRLILSYGSDIPLEVQGKTLHVDILQHPTLIEDSNPKTISVQTVVSSQRL
jgi:hypothetical protein